MTLTKKQKEYLAALSHSDNISVLFVCLGNICRSPAAEGVMKELADEAGQSSRFTIDSAGTGRWHIGQLPDKRMRVHAQRRGLTLDHICRQVSADDFDRFDLIIGMDSANIEDLRDITPSLEAASKIIPMGAFVDMATRYDYIPDPYYEGAEGFELVLDLLDNGCRNLLNLLTNRA